MTQLHPQLDDYYNEINPVKRHAHLKAYMEAVGQNGTAADAYRVALFNARHSADTSTFFKFFGKKKNTAGKAEGSDNPAVPNPPGEVDLYLRELLTLLAIYKNTKRFSNRQKKDVLSALNTLQVDDRASESKECEEVFYLELRNAIKRYFSTCHDSSYGRKLCGLASSSDSEKEQLRCSDTWSFSYGVSGLLDLKEEMTLLCRAANDEYCASVDNADSLENAFKRFGGKDKKS